MRKGGFNDYEIIRAYCENCCSIFISVTMNKIPQYETKRSKSIVDCVKSFSGLS